MNTLSPSKLSSLLLCAISAASISACALSGNPLRDQVADRIAGPAWLLERQIDVAPYTLTAFERMHERGQPATIYIEGDGMGETNTSVPFDATPVNPVALHLASKDKAINLAYLARPCQYSGMSDQSVECSGENWKENAYSDETMNAYNAAISKMKRRYGISEFNIVGYDSGATLGALLAATRHDVKSLRTVSGEFDLAALKPQATALNTVPQHHFTGGQDTQNPPEQIHAYLQMVGPSDCIASTFIQEAGYEQGFVDKWPELLNDNLPQCVKPAMPDFEPIVKPEPIFYPRMGGLKK